MGNICRSPMAQAVMRTRIAAVCAQERIVVDSAGTHDYHIGVPPDSRAQAAAARRGYPMRDLRGRQVSSRDFEEFDFVLAMDHGNLAILQRNCPASHSHKLGLLTDFSTRWNGEEVPDPYYGEEQGFEQVLDMIEDATAGLLQRLLEEPGPPSR